MAVEWDGMNVNSSGNLRERVRDKKMKNLPGAKETDLTGFSQTMWVKPGRLNAL